MTTTTTSILHRTVRLGAGFLIAGAVLTACGDPDEQVSSGPGVASAAAPEAAYVSPDQVDREAMLALRNDRPPRSSTAAPSSTCRRPSHERPSRAGRPTPPSTAAPSSTSPRPSLGGRSPSPRRPTSRPSRQTARRCSRSATPWRPLMPSSGMPRSAVLGHRLRRRPRTARAGRAHLSPPVRRCARALGTVGQRKLSHRRRCGGSRRASPSADHASGGAAWRGAILAPVRHPHATKEPGPTGPGSFAYRRPLASARDREGQSCSSSELPPHHDPSWRGLGDAREPALGEATLLSDEVVRDLRVVVGDRTPSIAIAPYLLRRLDPASMRAAVTPFRRWPTRTKKHGSSQTSSSSRDRGP